ncbi:MAG: PQQ-like beta-propeller repeat protein [Gemmatales bacterium]|nr:PQQ-like beta-propeller repeat protein [Gemmatales bacterium]
MRKLMLFLALAGSIGLMASRLPQGVSQKLDQDLSRVGLIPVWSIVLPRSEPREEVLFAQLLDSDFLLVQMRSGSVFAYDAFTGMQRWLVQLGQPFRVYQQAAIASQYLVVIPADVTLRIYERKSGVRLWQLDLNALPHRAPACDDWHLVVLDGENRLRCWLLPHVERYLNLLAGGSVPGKPVATNRSVHDAGVSSYEIRRQAILEPQRAWDFQNPDGFDWPAICASNLYVAFADRLGKLRIAASDRLQLTGEWQFPGPLAAPMTFRLVERQEDGLTIWESWLLVPCTDNALYAFRLHQGKLMPVWQRVLGDTAHAPAVLLAQHIFVATAQRGLFCLDRDTGQMRWHQPEAHHFVAASPRLVFAQDRLGRFLALDREHGHLLSLTTANGKLRAIANHFTDRVYLISEDGRLLALRDRDPKCAQPQVYYRLRFTPPSTQLAKPGEKPAEDKPAEEAKPAEDAKPE